MYSVVLATMLTTGTATPSFCHKYCGCYSSCHSSCFTSGYGCWGCWGGWGNWGCHGCYSGCYSSCCGCYSSCYGCFSSCCGCYSSCSSYWSCSSCSCYTIGTGCWGCTGCYGCSSCYGCTGCTACYGAVIISSAPVATPAVASTKATVVVSVPSDATLLVDGQETKVPASPHTFTTPALEEGKDYFYTMKVVANRNGKAVTEEQRVVVRAGQTSRVEFNNLGSTGAAAAKIDIHLPSDAKLFVDGVAVQHTGNRTLETPKLEPGQTYFYTMKAELQVNGQTQTETQRVVVEAGKKVNVEFTKLLSTQAASR